MPRSATQSFQRYPLTQVFGTETNVRLLRELSLHGGRLSAPSLVSRTGLAKGGVRTGLNALAALGVVTAEGSGHAQLYSLRADHPLRRSIDALFEAELARFGAIQDAIRRAAEGCSPPLLSAYVFGSVASGQDRPDSDLDILVVAEHGDIAAVTAAMRDALQEPGERIGFRPSIIGLSPDDVMHALQDAQSSWKASLEQVMVVVGRHPASFARPQRSAPTKIPA